MYMPDFIFEGGKHKNVFKTTENIEKKLENIENFLSQFSIHKDQVRSKSHVFFTSFSLDDLMLVNRRKEIEKFISSNRIWGIKFERVELIQNTFMFLLRFYK